MNQKERRDIIKRLLSNDEDERIYYNEIPEEYREDDKVIKAAYRAGICKNGKKCFDVENQSYYVYLDVLKRNHYSKELEWDKDYRRFDSFTDYYNYLNGDIYEDACYYKLDFSEIQKELGKELDIARLSKRKALIDYTIEDFSLAPSATEEADYLEGEKKKKLIKKWDAKFIACDTIEKLLKVTAAFEKSVLCVSYHQSITFFLWRYVFYDIEDAKRFEVIMQYMSTGRYPECIMIEPLCHVYAPNAVVERYNYSCGAKQTQNKHKRALREYAASILNEANEKKREVKTYFDTNTHYYCEKDNYGVFRYFETADELI